MIPNIISSQQDFLPFSRPTLSPDIEEEIISCLRSGWLTTGPRVSNFEEKLKLYCKAPHALALTSATAGLFLALKSLNMETNDEVITTPFTFVATLNTIIHAGAKPVLVDIDPHTYNIDITKIEEKINSKTKAIVPVHFAGLPVDLDPLYKLSEKYNLRIIEDAAHAVGSKYKDKMIGEFGDIQVFSFHPNKNITTGEGGAIILRDDNLAKIIKTLRFHGIDRENWNRFSKNGSQEYDVTFPGYKFNMMDLQAALGIHQLNSLEIYLKRREDLANNYIQVMQDWPQIILPPKAQDSRSRHSWHLFAILLNPRDKKISRNDFMMKLKSKGIGTGLHYLPCHLYSYYQQTYGYKKGDFPQTEYIADRILSLPLFPSLKEEEQCYVIDCMNEILFNK